MVLSPSKASAWSPNLHPDELKSLISCSRNVLSLSTIRSPYAKFIFQPFRILQRQTLDLLVESNSWIKQIELTGWSTEIDENLEDASRTESILRTDHLSGIASWLAGKTI